MKRLLCLFILMSMAFAVIAQTDRQHIRQGNKAFRGGKYDKAEVAYSKALDKKPDNSQALYNMGCVLMHKENTPGADSLAVEKFEEAAKLETNKIRKAMSYHNIGVIFQAAKDYAQAINAYREALRNNPKDDQTRYNLALCQKLLKQNGGGGGSQKDEKKDNKNRQQKEKKPQEQKNNKDKEQQNQPNNPSQQNKMSKENAQQLLNAAVQEEKNTQRRMQKAMQMPQNKRTTKNW